MHNQKHYKHNSEKDSHSYILPLEKGVGGPADNLGYPAYLLRPLIPFHKPFSREKSEAQGDNCRQSHKEHQIHDFHLI